jgi:hypothetical protein
MPSAGALIIPLLSPTPPETLSLFKLKSYGRDFTQTFSFLYAELIFL